MSTKRSRGFILDWKPRAETEKLINDVKSVLAQYVPTYGPMTLRQIFYRLISTVAFPKTEKDCKRLNEAVGNARRARLIGFDEIRDDGDVVDVPDGWDSLDHFRDTVQHMAERFTLSGDLGQPYRIIVMVEAAGMVPQVRRVCSPYGVEVRSAGGFNGLTGKYALAGNIIKTFATEGRPTRLLHIGDFDPSGIHVFSSLAEDVAAFVDAKADVSLAFLPERIALTEDQIRQFALPTAPAKVTDNRSFAGVNGDRTSTVQCEALSPADLARIVETAILAAWDHQAASLLKVRQVEVCAELMAWLARSEGV
jgi:hypothetical protein